MIRTNLSPFVRSLAATLIVFALTVSTALAQADPLPSWNDGPTKQAIVDFVDESGRAGKRRLRAP